MIVHTIAIINDPLKTVPKLYLKVNNTAWQKIEL